MLEILLALFVIDKLTTSSDTKPTKYKSTPTPKKKEGIVYEYWPAFDHDEPTIGLAYKLYEENQVCHVPVPQDKVCKCYLEFEADVEEYLKKDPNTYFDKI